MNEEEEDDINNILHSSFEDKEDFSIDNNEHNLELKILTESDNERAQFLDEELKLDKGGTYIYSDNDIRLKEKVKKTLRLAYNSNLSEKKEAIVKWKKEYEYLLKKEQVKGIIVNEIQRKRSYSINQVHNNMLLTKNEYKHIYLTKLLILLKVLFNISLLYKYSDKVKFMHYCVLIYRYIVIQFDVLPSNRNDSEQINNSFTTFSTESYNKFYFSMVGIYLLSIMIIIIISLNNQMEVSTNNFTVKYRPKEISLLQEIIYHFFLFAFTYLFFPLLRESFNIIFFITDQSNKSNNIIIFHHINDTPKIAWIKFGFACFIVILSITFIFLYYKLLKRNIPILDPFCGKNDNLFHHKNCPSNCSGDLLQINMRICQTYSDEVFIMDINRPIEKEDYITKRKTVLNNYYNLCHTIQTVYSFLVRGYKFSNRYYYIFYLLGMILYLILGQLPYSNLFWSVDNEGDKRSFVSLGLLLAFNLGRLIYDIFFIKKSFLFFSEVILNLMIDSMILVINAICLGKVIVFGNYLYEGGLIEEEDKEKLIEIFELISFSCLVFTFVTFGISILLSLDKIKKIFYTEKMIMNTDSLDSSFPTEQRQQLLLDYIWKPFWDNLFIRDNILMKETLLSKKKFRALYNEKYELNNSDSETNKENKLITIPSPLDRLNYQIKIYSKNKVLQEDDDEEHFSSFHNIQKFTQSDILLMKYIQVHLEGTDVYWEGEVIGKRTCKNYFGKLIVNEHPFELYMIYDETNEKVLIPKREYIALCKSNFDNDNLKFKTQKRNELRCLNGVSDLLYDEYYLEKQEIMKQKENDSKELENRYVNKKGKIKELIKNHYETILLKWLYQKEDIKDDEQEVLDQITSDSNSSEKNYKMMRVKKGTLYILSNDETDPFSQGFNIQLKTPSSVIQFDFNDVTLSPQNFSYSKLNILLTLNKQKIKKNSSNFFQYVNTQKRERKRKCLQRYIKEISLSSLFYDIIYNNKEITLIEVMYYFIRFEKRKEMKEIPLNYIEDLYKVMLIWDLIRNNETLSIWFIFFYQFWLCNKTILNTSKLNKYFDPDESSSICYCYLHKKVLINFFNTIDLINRIDMKIIDLLYETIERVEKEKEIKIQNEIKESLERGEEGNIQNEDRKTNKSKNKRKKKKIEEEDREEEKEELLKEKVKEIYSQSLDNNIYKSKLFEVLDYSELMNYTPSWVYLKYKEKKENIINDSTKKQYKKVREVINCYFDSKSENPNELYTQINKLNIDSLNLNIYEKEEIFTLYLQKQLNISQCLLTNYTINDSHSNLPLNLILPSHFSYENPSLANVNSNTDIKLDKEGRVFFYNRKNKTASFNPPNMKTRPMNVVSRLKNEKNYETMFYRPKDDFKDRVILIDHKAKKTSWMLSSINLND